MALASHRTKHRTSSAAALSGGAQIQSKVEAFTVLCPDCHVYLDFAPMIR
jgi:hypothetical protein